MQKSFVDRIVKEGLVDTRRYRYIARQVGGFKHIYRIDITAVETAAALDYATPNNPDGWLLVASI